MTRVLIVAPHPDDETLGCGGTILHHRLHGDSVHWLIATDMTEAGGFAPKRIAEREAEIESVAARYGFETVHRLGFPTATLDRVAMAEIVDAMASVVSTVEPDVVLVPFPGDIHTDHRIVFDAAAACAKWFRYSSIRRVLAYETPSETEFALDPTSKPFQPNVFVNISDHIAEKIAIMNLYGTEVGTFPFPRSEQAVRALAQVRGATAGYDAAEAFMLLREINS